MTTEERQKSVRDMAELAPTILKLVGELEVPPLTQQRYHYIYFGGAIEMPCGAKVVPTSLNHPCPNSGNCSAGDVTECWVTRSPEVA